MTDRLIIVCIPTYKRPALLRDCLTACSKLIKPDRCQINIIVADNDIEGSARSLCVELINSISYPLRYYIQPERGLSAVRNRLLEEAIKLGADLIAFIDDDEQPDPAWLTQHILVMHEHGADVCSGPVIPVGRGQEDPTLKRRATGSRPRHVSTNNVLIKVALVTEQGLRFDPFYNFIGGEDFDFFERSGKLGNIHLWVNEARVFETIPAERSSLGYLFYRHFSGGINSIMRFKRTHSVVRAWLRFLPKILGKYLGAIAYCFLSCVKLDKGHFSTAVKKLANGTGCLAGLLNVVVERYRNIDPQKDHGGISQH